MKAICPECGIIGSVQQRYNSVRIGHYDGYKEGSKGKTIIKVKWHSATIDNLLMVNNGTVNMVNNRLTLVNSRLIMVNSIEDLAANSTNSQESSVLAILPQTHNLENKGGQTPMSRGRGLEARISENPAPGTTFLNKKPKTRLI